MAMFQDRDSIKVFERMHARDQFFEHAHRLSGGDKTDSDADVFAAHAKIKSREALITNAFIVTMAVAVLVGGITLLWR
ncbi:MAG: hypothetical protein FD152_2673 [Xanthobacteraceae bacterium]|nr:MAG: hypothetical protein FD152_2673 [Xanthobacteraceae bacterium]